MCSYHYFFKFSIDYRSFAEIIFALILNTVLLGCVFAATVSVLFWNPFLLLLSKVTEITSSPPDIGHPAENPAEAATVISIPEVHEEQIIDPQETEDQTSDQVEEVVEVQPEHENHEESEAQDSMEASEFVSVSGEGEAGSGAPGPGTYESRVFNAVRRGYRTSVEPDRSYRVILTVNPDGTSEIEVVRKSGTSAFDRAVESALSRAQIPPMPPGRNAPAIINIEFLGPE